MAWRKTTRIAKYSSTQIVSIANEAEAGVAGVSLTELAATTASVYPWRDELVTVVIGNAEAIADVVAGYGSVEVMSIKTPSFRPEQ